MADVPLDKRASVALYAFTCGHLTLPSAFLIAGRKGSITVPVPAYLIAHPKGLVLFDSGLHRDTVSTPERHVGEVIARYHSFHFGGAEQISRRLECLDIRADRIRYVVNSHLHFDHCGGNEQLPNADVVVQRREVDHARNLGTANGYVIDEWDTGQKLKLVDGELDLFGDGTVVCVPTYGHTPGHQSLQVIAEQGGTYVLCGDACYLRESLEKLALPGIVADPDAALSAFKTLRELERRGARIMYGHDPGFWESVPQAPVRLG